MAFDIKQTIRAYVESFPDSFVGFIYTLADIIAGIGDEWGSVGKEKWSIAFHNAATNLRLTAEDLAVVAKEFDAENDKAI